MENNVIKIGTALKWRGSYDSNSTYYRDNVVTMYSCVFKCNEDNVSNAAPCRIGDEGYEFINTDKWTVVLDSLDAMNRLLTGVKVVSLTEEDFENMADKDKDDGTLYMILEE